MITDVANKRQISKMAVQMAWVMQQIGITSVLINPTNVSELKELNVCTCVLPNIK